MSLPLERKLPIILLFVFLMLTTIGVVFYLNNASLQDAVDRQRHTQEVVSLIDETVALAFESQSALYNFMLVSNETYLNPFERAKPKIRQNIETLRGLTSNRPELSDDINKFDQSLKEFVGGVTGKIERRKVDGSIAASQEVPWGEAQKMLDTIRSTGDRIKNSETALLRRSEQEGGRRFTIIVLILFLSSVAGIVSLALANLTVFSEIRKRRNAEKELIDVNSGLENNVQERTAELKLANEKLLAAGIERESILFNEKEARREAEIANRLRDEFMATVSHELRTPLNSILGWARLMRGGTLNDSQAEKALTTIIKNSETQNRLIEDLLDVARVISGKLQLDMVELSLAEVVSEAIETVKPTADTRDIQISLQQKSDDPRVIGDRSRLVQVFTNLLGNAIKFSHGKASIEVHISNTDDAVVTKIRDEGKGISPEFLPLVFERFRQDAANESNNGGLGLGLAIVRNLVEIHGGSVNAESKGADQGSTFIVELPRMSGGSPA